MQVARRDVGDDDRAEVGLAGLGADGGELGAGDLDLVSMQGAKLEAAKESARVTTEVLSPNDFITVIAFDSDAMVLVRPQRAGNRNRIRRRLAGSNSGGGTNISNTQLKPGSMYIA